MYQIRLVISLVCFYILLANTAFSQDTVQQRIAIITPPASLVMGNYAKIKVRIQAELHSRFAVGTDVKYYFQKCTRVTRSYHLQKSFSGKIIQKDFMFM